MKVLCGLFARGMKVQKNEKSRYPNPSWRFQLWMYRYCENSAYTISYPNPNPDNISGRASSRSRYPAQPPNFCQPNISLKNTASRNLSISAASVPVECLFSTTGLIANSKRSSLSADHLHKITFIHDNCKLAFQWLDFSIWVTMTNKFNNIQTVKQCVQH